MSPVIDCHRRDPRSVAVPLLTQHLQPIACSIGVPTQSIAPHSIIRRPTRLGRTVLADTPGLVACRRRSRGPKKQAPDCIAVWTRRCQCGRLLERFAEPAGIPGRLARIAPSAIMAQFSGGWRCISCMIDKGKHWVGLMSGTGAWTAGLAAITQIRARLRAQSGWEQRVVSNPLLVRMR